MVTSLLEGVRGADDLLVEPSDEFPLDAGDVGEHILPGLHILYDVGSFRRSRLRRHPGKANDPQDDGGYGAQSIQCSFLCIWTSFFAYA